MADDIIQHLTRINVYPTRQELNNIKEDPKGYGRRYLESHLFDNGVVKIDLMPSKNKDIYYTMLKELTTPSPSNIKLYLNQSPDNMVMTILKNKDGKQIVKNYATSRPFLKALHSNKLSLNGRYLHFIHPFEFVVDKDALDSILKTPIKRIWLESDGTVSIKFKPSEKLKKYAKFNPIRVPIMISSR